MSDVQVLGLTRFSYPSAPGAFGHDSLEDLRARLYGEARMALRFHWLEQVTLPSLRGQTDPDFRHLFLIGDQLPGPQRARLEAVLADIPQAEIVAMPEGENHRLACRLAMMEARDPDAQAVAEYRLDDDDAVGHGFVADLKLRYGHLAPLVEAGGRAALDYCRGLLLRTNGPTVELTPVLTRLWTPALAIYTRPGEERSLLDAPHLDIWKLMPVLSLRYPAMFVRGAHSDNASALSRRMAGAAVKGADLARARRSLKVDFGVDLQAFEAGWQALKPSG